MGDLRGAPRPTHHRSQRGLTLIEVLVCVALLAVIGGVLGATYSVGLKALGKGGAGTRLASAGSQTVFEQLLGKDVTRAVCVQAVSGATTYGPLGSCQAGFANALVTTACSTARICAAWPQYDSSSATWLCHIAVYTLSGSSQASRQEYSVNSGGAATKSTSNGVTDPLDTTDTVSMTISVQTTTPRSGPANSWVGSLTVAITNTGVTAGAPTDTLILRPLSSDPAGPAAAIETPAAGTTTGRPC